MHVEEHHCFIIISHDVLEIIINLYLLFIISHDGGDGRRRVNSGNRSVVGTFHALSESERRAERFTLLMSPRTPFLNYQSLPSLSSCVNNMLDVSVVGV